MTAPLVSVLVTTYEHEAVVAEALWSVLAQRAPFSFEVIVGVDRSTDATAEVVQRIEHQHPGVVRPLFHPTRVGLFGNFAAVYGEARGRYRALLEGDDYWTDPRKLERQVALLERRPEAVLCGHFVATVDTDGSLGCIPEEPYDVVVDRSRFVERLCDFHTSSLVFRDVFAGCLPATVMDPAARVFDLPLKLALAARGEILFVPEQMSVFRRVHGSASSFFDDEGWRDIIVTALRNARPDLPPGLDAVADRVAAEQLVAAALSPRRSGSDRWRLAMEALRGSPRSSARGLARGAYAGLPEMAKQVFRRSRRLWRHREEPR